MDKVYTRAQAEPGPTRLLPNHLGLPQTNKLGQCTPTGRYRPSSHQEDCCLPHGTYTTDARHQLFHHRPAASRLKSRKSFMRTVTPLDSSASSSRLRLWKDSLTDVPASVKMGLEVAESLPARSGEDWLCWRALNRLHTGVGHAKTVMRRWGYLDDAQSVDCNCVEPQTMAHLLSCRLLDEACTADGRPGHTPASGRTLCEGQTEEEPGQCTPTGRYSPSSHQEDITNFQASICKNNSHKWKCCEFCGFLSKRALMWSGEKMLNMVFSLVCCRW